MRPAAAAAAAGVHCKFALLVLYTLVLLLIPSVLDGGRDGDKGARHCPGRSNLGVWSLEAASRASASRAEGAGQPRRVAGGSPRSSGQPQQRRRGGRVSRKAAHLRACYLAHRLIVPGRAL